MRDNPKISYEQNIRQSKALLFVLAILMIMILSGCGAKSEPIIVTKYQEILTPIKCNVTLPTKPFFDKNEPQTAKQILIYYKQVEELLKECVDDR